MLTQAPHRLFDIALWSRQRTNTVLSSMESVSRFRASIHMENAYHSEQRMRRDSWMLDRCMDEVLHIG